MSTHPHERPQPWFIERIPVVGGLFTWIRNDPILKWFLIGSAALAAGNHFGLTARLAAQPGMWGQVGQVMHTMGGHSKEMYNGLWGAGQNAFNVVSEPATRGLRALGWMAPAGP